MLKINQTVPILTVALATMILPLATHASEWSGTASTWSSNANPGWNGTGVPNAVGAVADHADADTSTTTQDITGGVTVGTISLTNNTANYWTITNTNGITLDQDDAGSGSSTITNTNTTVGTANDISIAGGTLTLADNLLISNTSGSTYTGAAIAISSTIVGTGNIIISNAGSNNPSAGQIRFTSGVNTFTGTVLLQKGAMTYNMASSFSGTSTAGSGNAITLGQSGQGDATLVATTNLTLPNNITVAAGSGGTLTLGSISTSASAEAYSGAITLNGNVSLTSSTLTATNGLNFTGAISGVGSMTKVGAGILRLASANSYQGGTTVSAGTLVAAVNGALGTGAVSLAASTTLTLSSTVTNAISDSATLTLAGTGATAAKLNLAATTAGTLQETVAGLILNGVAQPDGTYGSAASGAANNGTAGITFTDYFTGNGILTVTSVPEPSAYAMMAVGLLGLIGLRAMRARRA